MGNLYSKIRVSSGLREGGLRPDSCPAGEAQSWYRRAAPTRPVNAPEESGEAPPFRATCKAVPRDQRPASRLPPAAGSGVSNEPRSLLTLQTKSPRWHVSRLSAAGHRHASPSRGGWRPNKTQGSACPLAHVGGFPGLHHSGNQKRNCGPLQGRGAHESRAEAITAVLDL